MRYEWLIATACAVMGWCSTAILLAAEPRAYEAAAVATVERLGGSVTFDADGHVTGIALGNRPTTDSDLGAFAGLKRLESLEVWGAEITDVGMESIGRMQPLQKLVLENTDVTDEGAVELARLANLRVLNLRR